MNIKSILTVFLAGAVAAGCTDSPADADFGLDVRSFEMEAVGGVCSFHVTASENWVATTDDAWLTVTPANGRGSADCKILVDSALTSSPRSGVVRIQKTNAWDNCEITVSQKGFDYSIELDEPEVDIANYAEYGTRYFDVKVRANVDFDVKIPDNAYNWLSCENYTVDLDRGIRPREISLRFNWVMNSRPDRRLAEVEFVPKSDVSLSRHDVLAVRQDAAEEIIEGRAGDSTALLAIQRSLDIWQRWDSSVSMDNWTGVELWKEGQDGYTPEKKGRVRSAQFYMFSTLEGLPFEVQYLTAADELYFFSNTNSFMRNLDTGEYIAKLTQLRRLTIGAYGLVSLHEDFKNLSNLEYLDLRSNNFQSVPEMINPQNFPKLRALLLASNQRRLIYDLSNTVYTEYGGLADEPGFPERLFEFDLDTLSLSVNYLEGELPTMEHAEKWSEADIIAADTLPAALIGIPKVLPHAKYFAINLNRLYGNLPDWLLYHPALDWWAPEILIFNQEGRATDGHLAGFDNEPVSMDYYYEFYKGFKTAPSDDLED